MEYQFNQITFDTVQYRISTMDKAISVEPQVFDLLVYLIENRNRVVTRDELLENLWKGKVVTDSALSSRLKDARKAVGDSGAKQAIIKTFHGRGYQFIADVSETSENSFPVANDDHELLTPPDKPSIAVLPFHNLSNDPEQDYFSEGMTTNICAQLSRIRTLKIKLGSDYDFSETTPSRIADELGVNYILRGSVQKEDDRVKVFVEFIDCFSGEIKWSEIFDRRGSKIMDIQDEIASAITGSLWSYRGVIRDTARESLTRKSTQDFNAFDCILKGVYHKEKITREDLLKAHEYLDKAKALDPSSAEAFAWSAWAHIVGIFMGWAKDSAASLEIALSESRNAIKIDPFSEIGHWALGGALVMDNDHERGFEEYDKAMEINPNNPDFMVTKGRDLSAYGCFDEGIDLIHKGFKFNHHHAEWYFWYLGMAYFAANRLEEAIESFNRLSYQNKDTRIYLAACYAQSGDMAEARNQVNELLKLDPETSLEEIAETHSYLNPESKERLVDGVKLARATEKPENKLRFV